MVGIVVGHCFTSRAGIVNPARIQSIGDRPESPGVDMGSQGRRRKQGIDKPHLGRLVQRHPNFVGQFGPGVFIAPSGPLGKHPYDAIIQGGRDPGVPLQVGRAGPEY